MVELSVALITYNSEHYIEETIASLLNQNCSFNYEIVVGDDCSTDKTFEIITAFKKEYPDVFNIKQNAKQLGILNNFKTTLDRCSGKYVFNFDGDDIVKSPDAFEKLVTVFRNHPEIGFVDSGYDKYFEHEIKTQAFVNRDTITASKKDYKDAVFLGKIIPIGTCFNLSLLMKYVDFKTYIDKKVTIEDYPTLVDMVAHCDFERINESLFVYRIHNKSYSYHSDFENYFFLRKEMLSLFNYFKIKYNFRDDLCEHYYQKYYKTVLYLAGRYEKKDLGKDMFLKIKTKHAYDYIHYLASQYKIVRKLVGLRKTKNLLVQKLRRGFTRAFI